MCQTPVSGTGMSEPGAEQPTESKQRAGDVSARTWHALLGSPRRQQGNWAGFYTPSSQSLPKSVHL